MWKETERIVFCGVAFSSTRMIIGAISVPYLLSNGLSLYEIGLLKTLQAVIIILSDIPLGYFADKYSRKLSTIIAMFFAFLWLFTMGIGTEKYHFFIAEAFNSISLAFFGGSFTSYMIDNAKKTDSSSINQLMGRYNKYQFLFMGVFSFLGAAFVLIENRSVWLLSSTACLLIFISSLYLLPKDVNSTSSRNSTLSEDLRKIKKIFFDSAFLFKIAVSSLLIISIYYQVIIQFWQPFSFKWMVGIPENGIFYAIMFSLILVAQSISGFVSEKVTNAEKTFKIGIIFGVLALLGFLVSDTIHGVVVIPSILIFFFSSRLLSNSLFAVIHSQVSSQFRATVDSVFSTVLRIAILVVMPIMGGLLELYGWKTLSLFYLFVVILLVIAFVFASKEKQYN